VAHLFLEDGDVDGAGELLGVEVAADVLQLAVLLAGLPLHLPVQVQQLAVELRVLRAAAFNDISQIRDATMLRYTRLQMA
jgi:hypothetical protein